MTPDDGLLLAYLDGQLDEQETQTVTDLLERSRTARERVATLRAERDTAAEALGVLAPNALEGPNAYRAVQQFRRKDLTMIKMTKKTRTIAGAVAGIVLLAGLIALQPVRAFASDVLSLFRVESFAVVDVDPERIEEIASAIDEGMYWGQADFIESGEPLEAADLAEAEELVGFRPAAVEALGTPDGIGVLPDTVLEFSPELETLQAVFANLGLDPNVLPEAIDGEPFVITVQAGVGQIYEEDGIVITQIPAPQVDAPEGVNMQELGEAMLQLLGMSPEEAARLSRSIDFTTTLVLPIPTASLDSVQEVNVNGTNGLLFNDEGLWTDEHGYVEGGSALLWQQDGFVYLIAAQEATGTQVLALAEALE
ncbi:MAG: hypothetical protein GYB64_08060 [Chloroflexi bacterium]|nr:hypothetical protein [Chloroflexota bacterium]